MCRDNISAAATERGVSGVTVNTLCVITPLTFLACQFGVRPSARKHISVGEYTCQPAIGVND